VDSHPPRLDDPELAAQRLPFEDFEEGFQPIQQGVSRCPRPKFEDNDAADWWGAKRSTWPKSWSRVIRAPPSSRQTANNASSLAPLMPWS
jgi:hypothetical protein